jgi:hypothetical protein
MPKKNEVQNQTFKKWFTQNLFAIMAIIVTLANLWLATKLAPLAQGVELNKHTIAQIKEDISELQGENLAQRKEIIEELKYIRNRVDNLYNICK